MARKLPSFPFYPGDWRKDPNLSRCSLGARGAWIDMICLLFECEERGVFISAGIPWTVEEICLAVGGDQTFVRSCVDELISKGVAKRDKRGAIFSARLVRDEEQRHQDAHRKAASRSSVLSGSCPVSVTPLSEDEDEVSSSSVQPEGEGKYLQSAGVAGVRAQSDGFAEFYAAYPKQVGETAARRWWMALMPDAELRGRIMATLKVYRTCRDVQRGCILNPAKWLAEERWTDKPNGSQETAEQRAKRIATAKEQNRKEAESAAPLGELAKGLKGIGKR